MTENRKPGFFYGYVVVVAAFIIMVIVFGIFFSFGVFFKPLLDEFGWTRAITSGVYILFFVVYGSLTPFAGRLNDRFGSRVVMTVCGFFLGLGYLLMSQVSAIWQLYLFYGVIVGIGLSGSYVPVLSTVARWFVKRRGIVTGIVVAGIGVGTLIAPPIANWLISSYGWRMTYIMIGIIHLLLVILAAQFLRHDPRQMGLLPYGENEAKQESLIPRAKGFSLGEAIHTKQFWLFFIILFGFGFITQVIMVHIVIHAIGLGISAIIAANILAIIGGISIIGRVALGSVADRIGNRLALMITFVFMSVALLWVLAAKELWMFYLFSVIFGFGYGGLVTLQSPVVAWLFGLRSHGVIFGAIIIGYAIGSAISPMLAGRIFDVVGSYQIAFWLCAALAIVAIILSWLLRPIGGEEGREPILD